MSINPSFARLDAANFEEFVSAHQCSCVLFIAVKEEQTEQVLSELIRLSTELFDDMGFGFVVTSDQRNRPLCVGKEICLTPLIKFFFADGRATQEQWVGYEQILHSLTENNLRLQFGIMSATQPLTSPPTQRLAHNIATKNSVQHPSNMSR